MTRKKLKSFIGRHFTTSVAKAFCHPRQRVPALGTLRALLLLPCLVFAASTLAAAPEVVECSSLILKDDCIRSLHSDSVKRPRPAGVKQTITTRVTLTQQNANPNRCLAGVSISYLQMYDKIRVDTTVVNDDCVASSGTYKIRARTRSPSGELDTREFIENWSRPALASSNVASGSVASGNVAPDAVASIEQRHTYEMSGDASLVWVTVGTSAKTACSCTVEGTGFEAED